MATGRTLELDRPLGVGELLATSVRIFNDNAVIFIGVGIIQAVAVGVAAVTPFVAAVAILAVAFTVLFALAARVIVGDSVRDALRRIGREGFVLVPLVLVVAVPFYVLGSTWIELMLLGIGWLALTAFAIPVVMLEEPSGSSWSGRLSHALRRTFELARADLAHAALAAAVLVAIVVLIRIMLAATLSSFAENSWLVAQALAQIVVAPFFLIALCVLYFEQGARSGAVARRG